MKLLVHKNENGFATLIALTMVAMLTLIGLAAMSTSDDEVSIAGNQMQETRAFYAAEAFLDAATTQLQFLYDSAGSPPTVMPSGTHEMNKCVVSYKAVDDGPVVQSVISSGSLVGLSSLTKTYSIISEAVNEIENAKVVLTESFEAQNIPLFQFAVFYNDDLWTTPAFDMTISGRTHVNGNMYLKASTNLNFAGRVTASGNIHHGWSYGGDPGGDVTFFDGSSQVSMQDGSGWLDADDAYWYDSAAVKWQGRVQDSAFGQGSLNMPLAESYDPHKIIEPAAGNPDSYENKAVFKIIDGVPMAKAGGVWTDVTGFLPAGAVTFNTFYDGHENKWVTSTDIDVSILKTSAYWPADAVIYTSDRRANPLNGTRLLNGADIGVPLSIYSENPVYIKGDFNTINKRPVAVAADAITFLSNNWEDSISSGAWNNRNSTKTTINAALVTGDIAPAGTNYGGGLENLPRFLENWAGTELVYSGSMIQGWHSQQAVGEWRYTSHADPYYSAPTRTWSYDITFNNPSTLPPATPMVRTYARLGWQQQDVGY